MVWSSSLVPVADLEEGRDDIQFHAFNEMTQSGSVTQSNNKLWLYAPYRSSMA